MAPDGTLGSHIIFLRVAAVPLNVMESNAAPAVQTRVQVDVYADNYGAASTLAVAVKGAMAAAAIKNVLLSEQDLFEDGTRQHRVSMDFSVIG